MLSVVVSEIHQLVRIKGRRVLKAPVFSVRSFVNEVSTLKWNESET